MTRCRLSSYQAPASLSRAQFEWYEHRSGTSAPAALWAHVVHEHPLARRLKSGRHLAPYLSLAGHTLLLHVGRSSELLETVELHSGDESAREIMSLLPRGIHIAPWRERGWPAYVSIDSAHRCVARIALTNGVGGMVDIVRDLLLILEVHEASEAANARETWQENPRYRDEDDDCVGEEWKRAG